MTQPQSLDRCPHCTALLSAVGTRPMGGMTFCGACHRGIAPLWTDVPPAKPSDDPRRSRPL